MGLTLPQAAQSNDVTGALQQLLMSRIPTPDQEQWQKQARMDTMGDYQNQLRQPAMGDYTPTMQSLYSMIEHFGPGMPTGYAALKGIASGGDMLAKQETLAQAGEIAAAKLAYENAKDEDKTDIQGLAGLRALAGAGKAGAYIQFKDDAGNTYIMNKATGDREIIPATQSKQWSDVYKAAYAKAVDEHMEDPEGYAISLATHVLKQSPGTPVTSGTLQSPVRPLDQRPLVNSPAGEAIDSVPPTTDLPAGTKDERAFILEQEWQRNQGDLKKFSSDPQSEPYQAAMRNLGILRKEFRDQYGIDRIKEEAPQVVASGAPTIKYKDLRTDEEQKSYGKEEGQDLAKERTGMSQLYSKSIGMTTNLNLLKKLYQDPNIPEGELGPYIQMARSGAKSFGIPVSSATTSGDLARAISEKFALEQRTAGEQNLLPGAISNYEDRLLARISPTLSMTRQGRLDLIDMMSEINKTNLRLAEEATNWAKSNKNQLTSGWLARKERVILEEMARLKHAGDEIAKKHGVK